MDSIKTRLGKLILQQQLTEKSIILFRFEEYPTFRLCLANGKLLTRESVIAFSHEIFRIPVPPFAQRHIAKADANFNDLKKELVAADEGLNRYMDFIGYHSNFWNLSIDDVVGGLVPLTGFEILGLFLDSNEKVI
jgi:hypothetical protein